MDTTVQGACLREVLRSELDRRQTRNPKYSLRAFARDLKMKPAHLSRILSGSRVPSGSLLESLLGRLSDLGPEGATIRLRMTSECDERTYLPITPNSGQLLSLERLSILEMIRSRPKALGARELAAEMSELSTGKRLSEPKVQAMLELLEKLGLIQCDSSGKYRACYDHLVFKDEHQGPKTAAYKRFQRELLEYCGACAERSTSKEQFHFSQIVSLSPSELAAAIEKAKRLERSLVSRKSGNRTHAVCISLVPIP